MARRAACYIVLLRTYLALCLYGPNSCATSRRKLGVRQAGAPPGSAMHTSREAARRALSPSVRLSKLTPSTDSSNSDRRAGSGSRSGRVFITHCLLLGADRAECSRLICERTTNMEHAGAFCDPPPVARLPATLSFCPSPFHCTAFPDRRPGWFSHRPPPSPESDVTCVCMDGL